jgi:hypothetical protein
MPSTTALTTLAGFLYVFLEISFIKFLNPFYFLQIWDGSKYDEFNGTIYDLNSIENMQHFMEYAIVWSLPIQNFGATLKMWETWTFQ